MAETKTKTDAELELARVEKTWQRKRAGPAKVAESFGTPSRDDPRWIGPGAFVWGDCYAFIETESFKIFPTKVGADGKLVRMVVYVEWVKLHVMHSTRLEPTTLRVNRHQGLWRFKASAPALARATGRLRLDLLAPEGHPVPQKRAGEVVPHMGEREEVVTALARVLGTERAKASELFFLWTGK